MKRPSPVVMFVIALVIVLIAGMLAGCETKPVRVVTDVKTVEVPPAVIPASCVDPDDIPEPFITAMPIEHADDPRYIKQRIAGADADLSWLAPRYAKARNLLIQCSKPPKVTP